MVGMVEMGHDEEDPAAHNVRRYAAVVFEFMREEAEDMRKYARDNLAKVTGLSANPSQVGQCAGMLGFHIGDALTYINKRAELMTGVLDILYSNLSDEYKGTLLGRRVEDAKMWRHAR